MAYNVADEKAVTDSTHHSSEKDHIQPDRSTSVVIRNAKAASDKEQKMTLMQGVRLYPKAIGWSMLISTCIVMEGFQVCLLSNFYAFPQFNKKYGKYVESNGTYQVPASWQAGLSNGANVGSIIGLVLNGWISERIGYRKTVMICLVLIAAFVAIPFSAPSVQVLLVGEILCGLPWYSNPRGSFPIRWGFFLTVGTVEIC